MGKGAIPLSDMAEPPGRNHLSAPIADDADGRASRCFHSGKAAEALARKRVSPADSSPKFYEDLGVYESVEEEHVVREFFDIIRRGNVTDFFYDDSLLPYKKPFIEYILIDCLSKSTQDHERRELEQALLLLTHFQKGIGGKLPIQLIDFVEQDLALAKIDIMELTDEQFELILSEDALRAHLSRVSALLTISKREFAISMYFARHPVAH